MTRGLLIALGLLVAACTASQPVQVEPGRIVYAILAEDDPAMAHVREAALADHLAFVEDHVDRYAVAGPLLDETGAMTRSLFLIYAENEAAARAFMANDPYVAGGLYSAIEYRRFTPAAGDWIGGIIWDPVAVRD
jgi:Uncharacterized protein conserved in bacteria